MIHILDLGVIDYTGDSHINLFCFSIAIFKAKKEGWMHSVPWLASFFIRRHILVVYILHTSLLCSDQALRVPSNYSVMR